MLRALIRVWSSCPPSGPLFRNPALEIRSMSHEFVPNSNCIVNAFEFSANSYGLLVCVQARSSNAVGFPSRETIDSMPVQMVLDAMGSGPNCISNAIGFDPNVMHQCLSNPNDPHINRLCSLTTGSRRNQQFQ